MKGEEHKTNTTMKKINPQHVIHTEWRETCNNHDWETMKYVSLLFLLSTVAFTWRRQLDYNGYVDFCLAT